VSEDGATIWVADTSNYRVSIWTQTDGTWPPQSQVGAEGDGFDQFRYPQAIAVSADGEKAWIADSLKARVTVWEKRDGGWVPATTLERDGGHAHRQPVDVAATADGKAAWVADSEQQVVINWLETGCVA
jgi:DNA-binding beta-propeller fold protein YncE